MAAPHSPETYHQHVSQYPTNGDSDTRQTPSRPPSTGSVDLPLLPDAPSSISQSQTISPTFLSSPLKLNAVAYPSMHPPLFTTSRTQSRQSMIFNRVPSEDSQVLASQPSSLNPHRTSMLLYRLADEDEQLLPSPPHRNRHSMVSNSGDSVFTVSYDSKYPSGAHTPQKLVPYPFDPSLHIDTPEDDDALHDPSDTTPVYASSRIAIRGYLNIGVLLLVIIVLLLLFIFYPIWHYVIQG